MAPDLGWLQLVSSASLTLMGLTVSVVAAVFTYRNNFGWPPLVLITSIGLNNITKGKAEYNATVSVEIWNRRKYPIVVRGLTVAIDGLELVDDYSGSTARKWHMYRNSMMLHDEHAMSQQTHEKHEVSAPFNAASLDDLNSPIRVEVMFFDPRINRNTRLHAYGTYSLNSAHKRKARPFDWLLSLAT